MTRQFVRQRTNKMLHWFYIVWTGSKEFSLSQISMLHWNLIHPLPKGMRVFSSLRMELPGNEYAELPECKTGFSLIICACFQKQKSSTMIRFESGDGDGPFCGSSRSLSIRRPVNIGRGRSPIPPIISCDLHDEDGTRVRSLFSSA